MYWQTDKLVVYFTTCGFCSLYRCRYCLRKSVCIQIPPLLWFFLIYLIRKYILTEFFERQKQIPRFIPYLECFFNILNKIGRFYLFCIHQILWLIFKILCPFYKAGIYIRYIIFFLLYLVNRIYKGIIFGNRTSSQPIFISHIFQQKVCSF